MKGRTAGVYKVNKVQLVRVKRWNKGESEDFRSECKR